MRFIKRFQTFNKTWQVIPVLLLSIIITWIIKDGILALAFPGKSFEGRSIVNRIIIVSILNLIIFRAIIAIKEIDRIIKRNNISPKLFYAITGGITGGLIFIFIFGLGTLKVTNVDWLLGMSQGDLPWHYIGWVFFRNDPWTFPLGITQSLGFPFGTSITFTDSIPLFAFSFKLISSLLPTPFQYFGIWTLMSFILQGSLSALIIYETTRNLHATIIAPFFFCLSNIMLNRVYYHSALSGQWIILAGLYLYFLNKTTKRNNYLWPLIFSLAILIHPYFLVMISIIFLATLIERFIQDRNYVNVFVWAASSFAAIIFFMWILGIFSGNLSLDAKGLGTYSANLNALYNPLQGKWSAFIKPIPNPISVDLMEGFNYLGAGMILLIFMAFFSLLFSDKPVKTNIFIDNIGILVIIIMLALISLSNVVSFNDKQLFTYSLPPIFMKWWNIVRSTGRMFWPIYYLIFIFAITLVANAFKNNQKMVIALFVALLLQYADIQPILNSFRATFSDPISTLSLLTSAFWNDAAEKYKTVIILPLDNSDAFRVGEYASRNKMRLNCFYFARENINMTTYANEKIALLKQGKITSGEIYLINDPNLLNDLCKVLPENTFFANVAGKWVVAPGFTKTPKDYPTILQTRADLNCK
jgi:hypothetical protein